MHKFTIFLLTILAIFAVSNSAFSLDENGCPTDAEFALVPYTDWTHTHSTSKMPNHSSVSGSHTHLNALKEWHGEDCHRYRNDPDFTAEHEKVEDPSPPVIEGYTKPGLLICVGGTCLEDDKPDTVVTDPVDLEGNVPPLPEPGEPELFYPTVEIDGQIYWDSTQEPYQVSEEAENAETTPEGYRLEDIDGQLLLVPYDTSKHTPVDKFEDTAEQDTFIIYSVVEVVGGQNYLKPTPFHAHRVDDSTNTGIDPQENQQSQAPLGTQDEPDIQGGQSGTFASLAGVFYRVTSNPPIPIQVTEYMIRTWGDGQNKLPQWIEIYNPNDLAVNLAGYEFSYVFKKQTHSIQLRHFLIPPEGAIILATHIPLRRYRYEGITESQVYNLKIEKALKKGWSLKDLNGTIISQTGKTFGETENPIMPPRVGLSRVSQNVYGSENPKDPSFFGFRKDVSSPGFYEPQIPLSPALLRQRMKTTWASFKKN